MVGGAEEQVTIQLLDSFDSGVTNTGTETLASESFTYSSVSFLPTGTWSLKERRFGPAVAFSSWNDFVGEWVSFDPITETVFIAAQPGDEFTVALDTGATATFIIDAGTDGSDVSYQVRSIVSQSGTPTETGATISGTFLSGVTNSTSYQFDLDTNNTVFDGSISGSFADNATDQTHPCLLYTSPSPRDS